MKKKFSTSWKASEQPRKQRKYVANAPINTKRKLMRVNLSKELRKSQGKRAVVLRKGDTVLIKRGKFKGKKGKVLSVKLKLSRVEVEGVQVKKQDGSKVNVGLKPWNLQITVLNLEERKKKSTAAMAKKTTEKKETENKPKKNEESKNETKPKVKENAS